MLFIYGHPDKMFCFPSPADRPIFFEKWKKKKIPDSLVKEASTLIYKHTILFYWQQLVWSDVLVFNTGNIDTMFLKAF